MAGQENEAHEIAERIGQRQNFGRHAAFGTADGLALQSPFCALSVAMDFDDGGVDHGVFHVRLLRAGLEKPDENIGFDPVAVALEDGVPFAEESRKITPWTSRPHDPKHRFDEAAVVAPAAPRVRRLTETMRFHLRPLGVRQYESFHPKLESQSNLRWNPKSQQPSRYRLSSPCEMAAVTFMLPREIRRGGRHESRGARGPARG